MLTLFRRKAQKPTLELPPVSLADEAVSTVGFHDAMKAQSLSELQHVRNRLAANIEAETQALAAVDEVIARELAIAELAVIQPIEAATAEIEAEIVRMTDRPRRSRKVELAAAE